MKRATKIREFETLKDAMRAAREHADKIARAEIKRPRIFSRNTAKMEKSLGHGVLTLVFHGKAAAKIGGVLTCSHAGMCVIACIENTGRMRFTEAQFARLWRTYLYVYHFDFLFEKMRKEIITARGYAARNELAFSCRLNGTTDLPWETKRNSRGENLFELFPDIQFYDYTKNPARAADTGAANYFIAYSYNEKSSPQFARELLENGGSVAMVFNTRRGAALPKKWNIGGSVFPVVDGDQHDLIYRQPRGAIIGLRYKMAFDKTTHKAIKPDFRFVQRVENAMGV